MVSACFRDGMMNSEAFNANIYELRIILTRERVKFQLYNKHLRASLEILDIIFDVIKVMIYLWSLGREATAYKCWHSFCRS